MIIETKFNLGQKVWLITNFTAQRIVKCKTCNCTGEITIANEIFKCPKCNGQAKHPVYAGTKWIIDDRSPSKIGKIDVERYLSSRYSSEKDVNKYMVESTGVGSGNVWEEDQLFSSEKEAQDYCDAKNLGKEFHNEI